ncbi:NAD(P)H-binding protein [Altererythrobacter xixiisoli]|uniref:NAD(P)H-binding protein n=1 Tax=Croceibacterium xixiisoli TaxID=1476466 RepID=A0A6I4TSW0_9SPHN|nr:NAD(P)H-binding protein [Croceibacterium xixiisoli]MXO98211.1 NAD(P)H-binding protein [Croceibacterium xixiisoli]
MTPTAPIAITGATGFVGQAVVEAAARQNIPLRALTRRDQPATPGVTWVPGDLTDHTALAELVRGCEAVLHIAGVVSAPDAAGFHAGNVAGTQAVLRATQDAGIARLICVSSLSAREPQLSLYGQSKQQAEQLVMATGLDWTIVRPPAVYGPRDREILELFRAARWGLVPMPPRGRTSVIHVDDLARLLLALVPAGPLISGKIFEPDDGLAGCWDHQHLARAIGHAVGRRVWAPNLPAWLLHAAARADGLLRGKGAKLTRDRVGYMIHPDWGCGTAFAVPPSIWQPQVETTAGLRATADWYRAQGWL